MKYIVGLGNPGKKYELTRHNIGFLFIDYLSDCFSAEFNYKNKLFYSSPELKYQSCHFKLIKPQTYMNLSGYVYDYLRSIKKTPKDDILLVYDDLHLPLGKFRFREKGSFAGHNGIKHIIEIIQSEHFLRLRLGIGEAKNNIIKYVLGQFSQEECDLFSKSFDILKEAIKLWLTDQEFSSLMTKFNGKNLSG